MMSFLILVNLKGYYHSRERLVHILLPGGWPTFKCIQLFGTPFERFEVFRAVVFDNLKLYPPIWGSAACDI